MKTIAGYVIVTVVCLLDAINIGEGLLYTNSCLTFDNFFLLKVDKFRDRWYEVRRTYDPLDPEQEDCVVMNYRLLENGSFELSKSFQMTKEGHPIYVGGTAEQRTAQESPIPQLYERLNTTNGTATDTSFSIATIDYKNYAILYSCTPINSTHYLEASWILSRFWPLNEYQKRVFDSWLPKYMKRLENEWRFTEQSRKFCKQSSVNELEKEDLSMQSSEPTTERSGENSSEVSEETSSEGMPNNISKILNYSNQGQTSGDSFSLTSKILFWVGLLAGSMLVLLLIAIKVALRRNATRRRVMSQSIPLIANL